MKWTREQFERDKKRYQRELDDLLAEGCTENDPRVRRQRKRLATVDRILTDPRFGMAKGDG